MKHYKKYLDYIENVGQPCKVDWFNDDWSPIGQIILGEMIKLKLVIISNNTIYSLTTHPKSV